MDLHNTRMGTKAILRGRFQPMKVLPILFLLLGLAATSVAEPLIASPDKVRTVVFFGDSLTAGYGLAEPAAQAFPGLIQEKLAASHPGWRVINAGLSGETTSGGLRRVDWILRQPVDIFVLELGGNDGLRGIEPTLSYANLQLIVDRVRAKYPSAKILLAGMQMPPSLGSGYTRDFAAIYPALAEKNGLKLVPSLLDGVGLH